jgi:hypothetical protein
MLKKSCCCYYCSPTSLRGPSAQITKVNLYLFTSHKSSLLNPASFHLINYL